MGVARTSNYICTALGTENLTRDLKTIFHEMIRRWVDEGDWSDTAEALLSSGL